MKVQPFIFQSLLEPMPPIHLAEAMMEEEALPAPTEPPVISYNEEELAAAKQDGYNAGYAAGEQNAMARINQDERAQEAAIEMIIARLSAQLTDLQQQHQAFMQDRNPDIARLITLVARKVATTAMKETPLAPLEDMINACMQTISGNQKLVISVHASLAEKLEHRLGALARQSGFNGSWQVVPAPEMHLQDARVEWKNGYADRNVDAMWQQLDAMVEQVVQGLFSPKLLSVTQTNAEAGLTNPPQDETNN